MEIDDAAPIKALGRSVSNYDDSIWDEIRKKVVFDGVFAKFSQNDDLKQLLIDTGDSILAEAAVKDLIWGIGLSMNDQDRFNPNKWHGKNLLGKVLMQVRDKLK